MSAIGDGVPGTPDAEVPERMRPAIGGENELRVVVGLASRSPLTMLDESHVGMDTPTRYAFYDALVEVVVAKSGLVEHYGRLVLELAHIFCPLPGHWKA